MNRWIERRWRTLLGGRFSSAELADFMVEAVEWVTKGSTTAVVGALLAAEQEGQRQDIRCRDWLMIPKTVRVDRLLPFEIPRVFKGEDVGRELNDQCLPLGLSRVSAERRADFDASAAAAFFCLLHGRRLELDHRMHMEMRVECPASMGGATRRMELTLMGYLPLGGRVVVATSRLAAHDVLAMKPGEVEHARCLASRWTDAGLRVEEARA